MSGDRLVKGGKRLLQTPAPVNHRRTEFVDTDGRKPSHDQPSLGRRRKRTRIDCRMGVHGFVSSTLTRPTCISVGRTSRHHFVEPLFDRATKDVPNLYETPDCLPGVHRC